jgi:hypothetical protein
MKLTSFTLCFALFAGLLAAEPTAAKPQKSPTVDEVFAELEVTLGRKLNQYPILVLKESPPAKLIAQLAAGMPACAMSKTPIQIITSHEDFAVTAIQNALVGLKKKKVAGLHIVIVAPTSDPSRYAKFSAEKDVVIHFVKDEG